MRAQFSLILIAFTVFGVISVGGTSYSKLRKHLTSGSTALCSENSQKCIRPANQLTTGAGIPPSILKELRRSGTNVTKISESQYFINHIAFGSDSWDIFANFADSCTVDPIVYVGFYPGPELQLSCLAPRHELIDDILREARSIAEHYASLMAVDFEGNQFPPIPGPLLHPRDSIMFHDAKIAWLALHARISDPQQENYPVLSEIRPGSYICTLTYKWRNAVQLLNVHKRNSRPERYFP